jgi:hypothetical protein
MSESKITKKIKEKMTSVKHLAAVITKNEDGVTVTVSTPETNGELVLSLVGLYDHLRKKGFHQLWKDIPNIAKQSK